MDFVGDGKYKALEKLPLMTGNKMKIKKQLRYKKTGVYFAAIRVVSQRNQDPKFGYGLLQNLARVRGVVK